jgi:hypothetical protein
MMHLVHMPHVFTNMKQLTIILIVSLFVGSCDPTNRDLPTGFQGTINITAKVINPRDSIGINDTVRVSFESLDTILYNGNKVSVNYSNNDLAYTDIKFYKIDRAYHGAQGQPTGSIIFSTIGSLAANKAVLTFQNNGTSMKGEYDFIPKIPGVYFFDQILPGFLSANGGQYKLDTYWNYGNINRNHQMLIDSAGASSNFTLFLQDRINNGFEVYGFKVK